MTLQDKLDATLPPKADRDRRHAQAFGEREAARMKATTMRSPDRAEAVSDWCKRVGNPQPVEIGA